MRSVAAETVRPILDGIERQKAGELFGKTWAGPAHVLTALLFNNGEEERSVVFAEVNGSILVFDPWNRVWLRRNRKARKGTRVSKKDVGFSKAPAGMDRTALPLDYETWSKVQRYGRVENARVADFGHLRPSDPRLHAIWVDRTPPPDDQKRDKDIRTAEGRDGESDEVSGADRYKDVKGVAYVDFDGTLVTKNTPLKFLLKIFGPEEVLKALRQVAPQLSHGFGAFEAALVGSLFKGMSEAELAAKGEAYAKTLIGTSQARDAEGNSVAQEPRPRRRHRLGVTRRLPTAPGQELQRLRCGRWPKNSASTPPSSLSTTSSVKSIGSTKRAYSPASSPRSMLAGPAKHAYGPLDGHKPHPPQRPALLLRR